MRLKILLFIFLTAVAVILVSFLRSSPLLRNQAAIQNNPNIIESNVGIEDIIKGKTLVAVGNGSSLYLIDPDFAKPVEAYTFKEQEAPIKKGFESFFVSPDKNYVVWYSPIKGLLSLHLISKSLTVVNPASDFLNTYPYVEFAGENTLLYITNNGNELVKVNLSNGQKEVTSIPYPYGNVFKISPNNTSVLFVSGYGQSQDKPKFMYTDIKGRFSNQFTTNTNLFDRTLVFWAPDSTGILLIKENALEFYPLIKPSEATVMFSLPKDNSIVTANRIGNTIFIFSKKGYWHVFDFDTQKEVARTPITIADELSKPKFYPWTSSQFIIEETIINGDTQFNRLWISDFRGNKKILIDRYNELLITTELDNL
jgi:hypothetical protein